MLWRFAVALVLSCSFAHSGVGQVLWTSSEQSVTDYDGFDASFDPHWIGDTDIIYYVPGSSGANTDAIEFLWIPPSIPPKPEQSIELISSAREISTGAQSLVSEFGFDTGHASDGEHEKAFGFTDFDAELHRYARVVNQDWLELARGNAVAEQQSTVGDADFHAHGRIGADTMLLNALNGPNTKAEASAANSVELTYRVNEETDFTLNGSLAQYFDIDMTFSIIDLMDDSEVYSVIAADKEKKSFDLVGTLLPGVYEFRLDSNAESGLAPDGLIMQSGLGEYSLDFTAFMRSGAVSTEPFANYPTRGGDVSAFPVNVPEPNGLFGCAVLAYAIVLRSRVRRK